MKVCFVSHSSGKYGAERTLLELLDALKKRGIKCYVVLPSEGPLINELKKRNIDYSILSYRFWMSQDSSLIKKFKKTLRNLALVLPLAIKIRRWGCDIVYTNTITVNVGALAAKITRKPHIWHFHEIWYGHHDLTFDWGERCSLWFISRFSSSCIANSKYTASKYRQFIAAAKLKVIYCSVEIPVQTSGGKILENQNEAAISCVIIGALQKAKRQEEAIRALAKLKDSGIKAELDIIGDGDPKYQRYLSDLASEEGLKNNVRFLGYVDNPFPIFQAADILITCSREEAFGRVTAEAMKLGKVVIGAKSGGTAELISEGFNGLLYEPGNYNQLARHIQHLHEHPDLAQKLGLNGQRWAEKKFSKKRFGEEVEGILMQSLIVSPPKTTVLDLSVPKNGQYFPRFPPSGLK